MDHIGNIIPDKDKYLTSLPAEPPTLQEEVVSKPSVAPEMPVLTPQKPSESPEAELVRMTLYKIKDQVDILLHLLELNPSLVIPEMPVLSTPKEAPIPEDSRILEGIFTGEKMLSDSGEIFDVPQNYASKSRLVQGDRMKLTIPRVGSFIYKQISPIERKRVRGELISGPLSGQWLVTAEGKNYKVLTASVTFNKGRIGDEVVLMIPAVGTSDWGAIEHLIHKEL